MIDFVTVLNSNTPQDVLYFQPKSENAEFDLTKVKAVIRRIPRDGGIEWDFRAVMYVGDQLCTVAGTYGDVNDVMRAAQYQFGSALEKYQLTWGSYTDADFPANLLPVMSDDRLDL